MDAIESFREAGREIAELDGFHGGHVLVDHDDGTLMTLTLWEAAPRSTGATSARRRCASER